jgi:uncharacterized protein
MADLLNRIQSFWILGAIIFINEANGDFSTSRSLIESSEFDIKKDDIMPNRSPFATFGVDISNACNLRCDYCFERKKEITSLTIDQIFSFLNECFETYPGKEKYFIDLSGAGEPLLNLAKILRIAQYAQQMSNRMNREVLVSFVCNGTLLSEPVVKAIQDGGILFGVSLDGNQLIHDRHRRDADGKSTFEIVMKNVKNIKFRDYVGCAVTLTSDVFDLVAMFDELTKIFRTVSVRPARVCSCSFTEESLMLWLTQYDHLAAKIVSDSKSGDTHILKAMLNGDDYFGRFLFRTFTNTRVTMRCGAFDYRISLGSDGKTYACAPASVLVNIGMNEIMSLCRMTVFDNPQCAACPFRFLCGGECTVEYVLSGKRNNDLMCAYKKHLILLAAFVQQRLLFENKLVFLEIRNFCLEKVRRFRIDRELSYFLKTHSELTFTDGKKLFDSVNRRY